MEKQLINDVISEYEYKQCEFEDIIKMLGVVWDSYYCKKENDIYVKADNYESVGIYLTNIYDLLFIRNKEMKQYIKKAYEMREATFTDK